MPRLRAAVLLAGALAAAACGGSGGDTDVAATTSLDTTSTTAAAGDASRDTAAEPAIDVPDELDFVAPDVRGGQVVGAELAGQAMVIWFWAPW